MTEKTEGDASGGDVMHYADEEYRRPCGGVGNASADVDAVTCAACRKTEVFKAAQVAEGLE